MSITHVCPLAHILRLHIHHICTFTLCKVYMCYWVLCFLQFVVQKSQCHIVLFKLNEGARDKFDVLPATWDGVMKLVEKYYPLAAEDCRRHLEVMKNKSCEGFEKEAGFKFLDAKTSCSRDGKVTPPHYDYEYYCSLPDKGNRKAWQTRLFLYCELRLFELFTGNGRTLSISGKDGGYNYSGPLQYISPNVSLSYLRSLGIPTATVELTLNIPNA